MPCKAGTRQSMEAARLHYKKERELDKTDPFRQLWRELVSRAWNTEAGYEGLSDAEKKYFAVGLLDGEVYNGGFYQYFSNSSADYYKDAEIGLQEMGATESLSLLKQAKQIVFGLGEVPEDTEQRRRFLMHKGFESNARLDELDSLFWEDPDGLSDRGETFARRNTLI